MTTDGKAYYYVSACRSVDDDYQLDGLDIMIGTTDMYDEDGPYDNEQGEISGVSSYETLDKVKKALQNDTEVKWNGNRFKLDYSSLCDADRKALDEYFTYSKQAENKDIPDIVDEEYVEPDSDDKEFGE